MKESSRVTTMCRGGTSAWRGCRWTKGRPGLGGAWTNGDGGKFQMMTYWSPLSNRQASAAMHDCSDPGPHKRGEE
jgi:hypothetical protein